MSAKLVVGFLFGMTGLLVASTAVDAALPETRLTLTSIPAADRNDLSAERVGITREDALRITSTIPNIALAIPVREFAAVARKADRTADVRVVGTTHDFARIRPIRIQPGRFLNKADSQTRENVVVVGPQLAQTLFPQEDAVGQTLMLEGQVFKIIGAFKPSTTLGEREFRDAVLMPISTLRSRFGDMHLKRNRGSFSAENMELSRLELVLDDPELKVQTQQAVEQVLRRSHKTKDYQVTLTEAKSFALPQTGQRAARKEAGILAAGVLESAQVVELANRLPGESTILSLVAEGAAVKKGDVLLELENESLSERKDKLRLEMLAAERRTASGEFQLRTAEVDAEATARVAKLQVEAAELERQQYFGPNGQQAVETAALEREIVTAEKEVVVLTRALKAVAEKAGADSVPAADTELKRAKAQRILENARDGLRLLKGPTRALRTKMLELKIATAESEATRQRALGKNRVAVAKADLLAARSELELARERFEQVSKLLTGMKVVSPIDGVVIYNAPRTRRTASAGTIEVGAQVRQRQALLKVTDMQQLQVRVRVHESKIRAIRRAQKCTLVFDALPNTTVSGEVTSISNLPVPATFPRNNVKEYDVIVSVNDKLKRLRLGMTCEARFADAGTP